MIFNDASVESMQDVDEHGTGAINFKKKFLFRPKKFFEILASYFFPCSDITKQRVVNESVTWVQCNERNCGMK